MTDAPHTDIPHQEVYRGVGIEIDQSPARVVVVRAAIDTVHAMSDPAALCEYAGDVANPPEARLFAAAKVEAALEIAAAERAVRPNVDIELVQANVAGLGCLYWRDPWRHASLLDAGRTVEREEPLSDETQKQTRPR